MKNPFAAVGGEGGHDPPVWRTKVVVRLALHKPKNALLALVTISHLVVAIGLNIEVFTPVRDPGRLTVAYSIAHRAITELNGADADAVRPQP